MPPVDISSSIPPTSSCAFNDMTGQAANAARLEQNDATSEQSLSHEVNQLDRGKLLELAALKENDLSHILLRRRVADAVLCLDIEGNFLDRDAIAFRQMVESGDQDLEECHKKFMTRLDRFYQFGCRFSKILEYDEPSRTLLNNVLYLAKSKWGEERGSHLMAEKEDWASLCRMGELDRVVLCALHHPLTFRLMKAFGHKPDEDGALQMTFIPMWLARFALVGLFNCFVGVFVSAPVAIMTLNSMSPEGMVVTYLSFILVAGFMIQYFVKGFTRQLLVYLAYASVMAAVMRLKD